MRTSTPTRTVDAPPETGRRLAVIPRDGGREELRVALDEFRGKPYVNIRVWRLDVITGAWWPITGKGVSVRLTELADVAEALATAADLVAEGGA